MNWWPRFKLFLQRFWLPVAVVVGFSLSVIVPLWYLAGMEESVRRYIVGINVASLPWGILQTLVFVAFLYLLQYGGGFAQFKKASIDSGKVQVKFDDVIGLSEAKREAWEVVQLIKDRTMLKKIGGRVLKGLLLMGPPGCGKTLLAKAIATEAGIPFLSVSGSEFVEIFVGVGASRVRKLFKQARQYSEAYGGCIIFIDELEVLGRTRVQYDAFGGGQESNQTLNQLLVEMDGIADSDAHVLVIGAMNMAEETLDPALLRPGRFDRKLTVGRPTLHEREQIFAYYAKKIRVDPSVDFGRLARKAVHKTPAEIENILKEAALIATRNGHDLISYKEISEAIERIELGVAHRLSMTPREREMTAFHEAGHLVVMYLTHPTSDVFKASIIQRGGVLGVVHGVEREELYSRDRNTYFANIKVSLAGYVAERFQYGVTTDGVSSDFANATAQAHAMVWKFGMSGDGMFGDFTVIPKEQLSESLKEKLNSETQAVLKKALAEVESTLKTEWQIVQRFAQELLTKEELDFDEIASIFAEFGKQTKLLSSAAAPLTAAPGSPVGEAKGEPSPGALPQPAPASRPPFA
ncbi:MAG: AAA family ATPase [Elusimicrobia bacterium]|nr:AAA family ATPase [Elusimicrobiota bacterium]